MIYDELLIAADNIGLIVKEAPLRYYDGKIDENMIVIRRDLTTTEKGCILAEEIGHYLTSAGDILDQNNILNKKQEFRARAFSYDMFIGLGGIVDMWKRGCETLYDAANYINVSEKFLLDAIQYYKKKYGVYTKYKNYIIYFEPTINVETI